MEQIYDSRHSGREVDNVVDAVQTTIPNQLTQIGSKLGDLGMNVGVFTSDIFELGDIRITNSGWSYYNSSSRVRPKQGIYFHLYVGDTISLSDYTDARFYVGWRLSDGTYRTKGWNTSDFTVTEEADYVFVISNLTDRVQTSKDALFSLLNVSTSMRNSELKESVKELYGKTDLVYDFPATTGTYVTNTRKYDFINGHTYKVYVTYPEGYAGETYMSVRNSENAILQGNILRGTSSRNGTFTCSVDGGTDFGITVSAAHDYALSIDCTIIDISNVSTYANRELIDLKISDSESKVIRVFGAYNSNSDSINKISYESANNIVYITDIRFYIRGTADHTITSISDLKTALGQAEYDIAPSGANSIAIPQYYMLVHDTNNAISIVPRSSIGFYNRILVNENGNITAGFLYETCIRKIKASQIPDGIITTAKINDGAVTTAKIEDGAVTNEKLSKDISGKTTIVKNIGSSTNTYVSYVLFPYNFVNGKQYKIKVIYNTEDDVSDLYFSIRAGESSGTNTIIQNGIGRGVSSREVIFTYTGTSQDANLVITMVAAHTSTLSYTVALLGGENDSIGGLDMRVSNLESVVPISTDILALNPESEILPIMRNFKHRLRNSSFVEQNQQFVLLQLTDQHADATHMARAIEFKNHYSSYIDDIIHTGDIVSDKWQDGISWFDELQDSEKILQVIGNHDVFVKAGSDGKVYTNPNDLTQYIETTGYVGLNKTDHSNLGYKNGDEMVWVSYTDIYNRYIAPYISNWGTGVTQPADAATNGLNYYYKDYSTYGIRLIVLDCMAYDTEQNTWLVSALAGAKTSGYGVIVAEHYPIKLNGFEQCAFTSSGYSETTDFFESEGNADTLSNAQNAISDFINGGGEFICWLAGHTHKDFCGVLKNHSNQVMFISDCTGLTGTSWSDSARINNTKSGDTFTIISVDRYKKIVRFYRVGNQWDRYGRHKVSMAFDYRAAKMIYSS